MTATPVVKGTRWSQAEAYYRLADNPVEMCGKCDHYRAPNRCTWVRGVIEPGYTCRFWIPATPLRKPPAILPSPPGEPWSTHRHIRVIVLNVQGQMLLLQRADRPTQWEPTSGTVGRGDKEDEDVPANETDLQAAHRELEEETGYGGPSLRWQKIGVRTWVVVLPAGVHNPRISSEHIAYRWISPEEAEVWLARERFYGQVEHDVLHKIGESEIADLILRAAALEDWDRLADLIAGPLGEAAGEAVIQQAAGGIPLADDALNVANDRATSWAAQHSAELVTQITESTRAGLRSLLEQALRGGWSPQDLAAAIQKSSLFDARRAMLIARTELAFAHSQGTLAAWKSSGAVVGMQSLLSNNHKLDDICDENEEVGAIALDEKFPSGHFAPPYHPNCACAIIPVYEGEDYPNEGDPEEFREGYYNDTGRKKDDTEKVQKEFNPDQARDPHGRWEGSGDPEDRAHLEEQQRGAGVEREESETYGAGGHDVVESPAVVAAQRAEAAVGAAEEGAYGAGGHDQLPLQGAERDEAIRQSIAALSGQQYDTKGDFAILTAENPKGRSLDVETNYARNREMFNELGAKGYQAVPVLWHYHDEHSGQDLVEHSYLVSGIPAKDAIALGRKFGQNSIISSQGLHDLVTNEVVPQTGIEHDGKDAQAFTELPDHHRLVMNLDWNNRRAFKGLLGKGHWSVAFLVPHEYWQWFHDAHLADKPVKKYSPEQPRDYHGEFGSTGDVPATPLEGDDAEKAMRAMGVPGEHLEPRTLQSVYAYEGYEYHAINNYLRGLSNRSGEIVGDLPPGGPEGAVKDIDSAMRPAPAPLVLYRGVREGDWAPRLRPGTIVIDKGFTSTSLTTREAIDFTGYKPDKAAIFRIEVPQTTPVVWTGNAEKEVILGRGGRYEITGQETRLFPGHGAVPVIHMRRL